MHPPWRTLLYYGALAALLASCLFVLSLAPLRFDAGRELVAAVIALVGVGLGLRWARRREIAPAGAGAPERGATQDGISSSSATAPEDAEALLTPRENHVLALLAEGQSNKAIARALGVSENTVKTHLARLYAKLGAGKRTQAIAIARRKGLIS